MRRIEMCAVSKQTVEMENMRLSWLWFLKNVKYQSCFQVALQSIDVSKVTFKQQDSK